MFDDSSFQSKDILHFEKSQAVNFVNQPFEELGNDNKGDIIQINDEQGIDEEIVKKRIQNKQKYQKMKRKLSSVCSQHQDKWVIRESKEVSSPNKSRILTLAIEFEKYTLNQTKDYQILQSKLKQIHKILDHKRQHDLLILKQSRLIPAFFALLKKVPSFHKNQFHQANKSIELGLKLLRIFCTLSSNRDYLIFTNQIVILNSSLSCFLGKEERKLGVECFTILNEILGSRIKAEAEPIVSLTIQLVFFGQLGKKMRSGMELCMSEDGLIEEEFVLKGLKLLYTMLIKIFRKNLEKPLYEQPELIYYFQYHSDSIILFLQNLLTNMLLEKSGVAREEELPVSIIHISLYILKLLNLNVHINVECSKSLIKTNESTSFVLALKHLFLYSEKSINEGNQVYEITQICSEIIIFLGKICFNSTAKKSDIRNNGLLHLLYNHPITYLMDSKLKAILMPTLCSVMDDDKDNIKKYLEQSCIDGIIDYIKMENKLYEDSSKVKEEETSTTTTIEEEKNSCIKGLTRKSSVSSLNSYTTQCTQNSYSQKGVNEGKQNRNKKLLSVIPYWKWGMLIEEIKKLDD